MAAIQKKLAKKLGLDEKDDIVYGRVNDIYVNIRFNKPPKRDNFMNLIDKMTEIKYDSCNIDIFANKDDGIDLKELNRFIEMNYWELYRANKASHIDGRLSLLLFKKETPDIKVSYVAKFLVFITDFLKKNGYYSGCSSCSTQGNLSYVYKNDMVKEICESCRLKEQPMQE